MPDTDAVTSTVPNQLPPRTTTSHRWPRKWATLGGRGSTLPPQVHLNENEKINGNGHRHTTSLFRKSSTISRTNGAAILNTENSLTKSRSLINVLRSKLNSPAVLRRFRTKSRESSKPTVTEIHENDEKKSRKRDPSPMKRLTSRLAQLTRSSTHTSIESSTQQQKSPSPPPTVHNQDQVDHINACYDEIRAKYFDKNNNNTTTKQTSTLSALSQHPCAPLATDRLKDMLSTTTTSSVDYYDRPNGDIHNRSLSTISMNGSLLSHDFLNNSQALSTSPPKATIDDPALQARKQSNIKLNCMLSGYGFKTPFGNLDKTEGEHDIFKFHHYHDVGKRKFDWNMTSNNNRLYSSLRPRPISRSIDNFRRATTTIENEKTSLDETPTTNELVIREDSDMLTCSSKIHVQPAVSLQVKTFISSTSADNQDDEFEKNFLRAVDRALGVSSKDDQPLYDTPMKIEQSDINLLEITERALSNFKNTDFLTNDERKEEQNDDEHKTNGSESPNVELFDRTGELLNTDNIQWQTSAVYDQQQEESNPIVCSVVDDLTRKTQDLIYDEPQNGRDFLTKLDEEERMIKSKADVYNKLLQSDDNRLTDEIRSDINAAIGEVNLLLRGKLKQFRGLCQANVTNSTTSAGEPTPLDSDLEGFWDITYPLIDKVKVKFSKLDVRKAKQWAPIEDEYDPNDVNNRPRIIDDRLKQLQPHQNKTKITNMKTGNDDLKKLIQERRKAAANASNQNHDVEIFVAQK